MSDRAARLWRRSDRDMQTLPLADGAQVRVDFNPFLPNSADPIVMDAVRAHLDQNQDDAARPSGAVARLRNRGEFQLNEESQANLTSRLQAAGFLPENLPAAPEGQPPLLNTVLQAGLNDIYAHRLIDRMRGADSVMSDAEATASPYDTARLQIALKTLGYDTGPVTGEYNAQARAAMAAYTADFAITADQVAALRPEVVARTDVTFADGAARPDLTSISAAFTGAAGNNGLTFTEAQQAWAVDSFSREFSGYSATYRGGNLPPPPPTDAPRDDRTFLMVSPQEQTVMPEKLNAFARWEFARSQLAAAGNVVVVDGREEFGQSLEIFARDKAFIVGNVAFTPDNAIAAQYRSDDRDNDSYQREVDQQARVLGQLGLDVVPVEDAWFEGGNVIVDDKTHTVFIGYQASDNRDGTPVSAETEQFLRDSIGRVGEAVRARLGPEWQTMPVPLTQYDPFYHLDTAMSSVLPNGQLIMYPGATDPETYAAIQARLGEGRIIEIDQPTAQQMVTNFEYAGNTLVMTAARENIGPLAERLEGMGYTLRTPDEVGLDSGVFQSGGYRCMTLAIDRLAERAIPAQPAPAAPVTP